MSYLPEHGYKRILVLTFYIIITAAAVVLAARYLFRPLLPFIIAWCVAMLLQPLIEFTSRKTRMSKKIIGGVYVFIVIFITLGLVFLAMNRVYYELRDMVEQIGSDTDTAVGDVFDFFRNLADRIPLLDSLGDGENAEQVRQAVSGFLDGAFSAILEKLPGKAISIVSALPDILFFTVILIVASFYMCAELKDINGFVARQFPEKVRGRFREVKQYLATAGVKYVRAYSIILAVTFIQLLVGFFMLRIRYALILALIIALIDILPVLGIGVMLLPWAGVMLIRGDYFTGIGLIIIFIIISVVRQIVEPKIVGVSIGLPPVVTLIAMYAGYKFSGIGGMLLFPIASILLKNLNDSGAVKLWKTKSGETGKSK